MLRMLILIAAAWTVQGQSTNVNQCPSSQGPLPLSVYIEGCTTPPCELPQGQDAVINMSFRAPRTMNTMVTRAVAYLTPIPIGIPYDLQENSQTCNFLLNASCPVQEGQNLLYSLKMHIEDFFPVGTRATVEFRIVDENNSSVVCLRAPILITPPVNPVNRDVSA